MNKRETRVKCAGIRKSFTPEYAKAASEIIEAAVLDTPEYAGADTVFIYVAAEGEPETRGIILDALGRGKTVLVPRCAGEIMQAVRISSLRDLVPGSFRIPEPAGGDAWNGRIDLTVVPCTAASRDLSRLGRGMGYYDRFLAGRDTFKLCLCFNRLICDFPTEKHDIKMDAVITEMAKFG